MKFKIDQNLLVKSLNIVSKAVSVRTTIPTLKGILLELNGEGILKLTASDMDITIEDKVEVLKDEEFIPGKIIAPSKLFNDIVRKLPDTFISIETDMEKIKISCPNSDFSIVGMDADEFPHIKNTDSSGDEIIINKDAFCSMVRKTSFAASIDQTKGVITGILLELKKDYVRTVAIDGYRMAIYQKDIGSSKESSVIISAHIMNEIVKIVTETTSDEDEIKLITDSKSAVMYYGGIKVIMRLIGGKFVQYEDILPKEFNIKIKLDRLSLIRSVERASILSREGKNNLIKLAVTDKVMTISSKSEEGNVTESLICSKEGDDIEIGFNAKYVMDILRAIEDDEIVLHMNTPVSPCLVLPTEGNSYKYLLLPVRLTNI